MVLLCLFYFAIHPLEQALQLLNSGKYQQSFEIAAEYAREHPESPSGHKVFARILISGLVATNIYAQQENLPSLYSEAQEAIVAGNQALAAAKYEQIVQLAPTMAEAFANLGNAYYSLGKTEQAAKAFRQAVKLKPQLTGPHFFLGVIEFNQHLYDTAAVHLATAEKLEPQNPLVQAYFGYAEYGRARYAEAAKHLELAAIQAGDPDILYHLSKTYGQLAKEAYGALHAQFPGSFYDNLAQAHGHEAAHEWEAALANYQRALKETPENLALRRRLDTVAGRISNASVANTAADDQTVDASLSLLETPPSGEKLKELYRELIGRTNRIPPVSRSGESMYRAAENFQSLAYLASLRVLEEAPDSYRSHQLKGESLEAGGSNDEAIAEYRNALQTAPKLPSLHFAIANIYWKTNRLAEAMPELRSELQVDPNNAQALYELGDVLADSGNSEEAERCFLKASKLQPRMAEPHLGLEKIYSTRMDYPKAILHLQAAAALDPLNATPHYRMATIYRKLGRTREADKEMQLFGRLKSVQDN